MAPVYPPEEGIAIVFWVKTAASNDFRSAARGTSAAFDLLGRHFARAVPGLVLAHALFFQAAANLFRAAFFVVAELVR